MAVEPELVVQPTADRLAEVVALRVLATLATAQQQHGRAALALTAGSIMEKTWGALAATAATTARNNVDWAAVDVFWADERYVASDSADRNDRPAREILFAKAPFTLAHLYPMPATDSSYPDLDAAAAGYAEQLAGARRPDDSDEIPNFDVVLLGVGPDGHCASLFPGHPGLSDDSSTVIAVRDSPKPPPNRISLSFRGLAAANEIWFVASGTGKADAVARAWAGQASAEVPSARPRGRERTLWLVDADAAANLPAGIVAGSTR